MYWCVAWIVVLRCSDRGHLSGASAEMFFQIVVHWRRNKLGNVAAETAAISFTVEELIKEYSALDIRKIVSSSGKSSLFVWAIPNSASKSDIALSPLINMVIPFSRA